MDGYSPVKGKCKWWRENLNEEDAHNIMIPEWKRRVHCTCFVEGYYWTHEASEVPLDCPHQRTCRYYIKHK